MKTVVIKETTLDITIRIDRLNVEISEAPEFGYIRFEDGSEYEYVASTEPIVRAVAVIRFDYDADLYDYISEHIISELDNIPDEFERLGRVMKFGVGFRNNGEYEEIRIEVVPDSYIPITEAYNTIASRLPEMIINAITNGLRRICEELNCQANITTTTATQP